MGITITPKIKDCLPLVNGIWYYIDYQFPEVFDIDSSQLDIMFMSNWSLRSAAPILKLIHSDEDTTMLTPIELLQLASVLKGMFKNKWDKMMNVAIIEYDPIHNYHDHMIEEIEYGEEVDRTKSGTGSNSNTRTPITLIICHTRSTHFYCIRLFGSQTCNGERIARCIYKIIFISVNGKLPS